MLSKNQIILIQTAARKAGLRNGSRRERYDLVLRQYRNRKGEPVTSCKELTDQQIDDFLAICESLGWRYPGKSETYCRDKAAQSSNHTSYGQMEAIKHLSGDLGFASGGNSCLAKFISRMTHGRCDNTVQLSRREAYNVIEALKAILERRDCKTYHNCTDIQTHYTEVETHGKEAIESCPI
ncbi:MAG: regulatory protein GemA [Planctomycetaceae bacterium]|nr:regulatory protein GemA [Planctomycetaceae bacterium]